MDEEKKTVEVPVADFVKLQETLAALEKKSVDQEAETAGLRQLMEDGKGAEVSGDGKLREKKSYEPKFRTVRIRKYPMAGKFDDLGYVVGWTNRGAFQEVDKSGVTPQYVDMIEVFFLGHEKNAEGKLQAEKIRLLDLLNKGEQVHCKIVNLKRDDKKVPTGEEINVTTWDPQHGLVATGDIIDGWVGFSDLTYTIEIPGKGQVEIDALYCN
jgi:hypothetical protein